MFGKNGLIARGNPLLILVVVFSAAVIGVCWFLLESHEEPGGLQEKPEGPALENRAIDDISPEPVQGARKVDTPVPSSQDQADSLSDKAELQDNKTAQKQELRSIQGRVIDEKGEPLSRAWVKILRTQGLDRPVKPEQYKALAVKSSAQGRFAFEKLLCGTYTICAILDDLAGQGIVLVKEGDDSLQVPDLVMKATSNISGWVKDLHGNPVANASVIPITHEPLMVKTNGVGRFSLKGLQFGAYILLARGEGYYGSRTLSKIKTGTDDLKMILSPLDPGNYSGKKMPAQGERPERILPDRLRPGENDPRRGPRFPPGSRPVDPRRSPPGKIPPTEDIK